MVIFRAPQLEPRRAGDWAQPLLDRLGPDEHIGPDSPLNGQEPIVRLFAGAVETTPSVPSTQEVSAE